MKIVFLKQDLVENLIPLMGTISTKNTISSLEGVLLETIGGNTVRLSTYDMNKGTRTTFDAIEVIEEGSYIINAQKLLQVVRVLDDGEVTIEIDSKYTVHITSGSSYFTLYALKGEDFPNLPELTSEEGIILPSDTLKSMILRVSHSISDNDSHPNLKGLYFTFSDHNLKTVSCDSYTLSECVKSCEVQNFGIESIQDGFSFILPQSAVNELTKILQDKKEEVVIYVTKKYAIFKQDHLIFFTRLIEGNYFDYKRIVPKSQPITLIVKKEKLLTCLERALLVAEEKLGSQDRSRVILEIKGNKLSLTSTSSSGKVYDEMECEHTGDDLIIGFNGRYLFNSVKVATSDYLKFGLTSHNQALTIRANEEQEDEKFFYMIVPVKLHD